MQPREPLEAVDPGHPHLADGGIELAFLTCGERGAGRGSDLDSRALRHEHPGDGLRRAGVVVDDQDPLVFHDLRRD